MWVGGRTGVDSERQTKTIDLPMLRYAHTNCCNFGLYWLGKSLAAFHFKTDGRWWDSFPTIDFSGSEIGATSDFLV